MSTTSIRRLATPVVAVLVFALAAAALVGAGIAIGSSARAVPGAAGSAAAAGGSVAGDLDALLAADQSAARASRGPPTRTSRSRACVAWRRAIDSSMAPCSSTFPRSAG